MPGMGRGRGMPPMAGGPARAPARPASSMNAPEHEETPINDDKKPEEEEEKPSIPEH